MLNNCLRVKFDCLLRNFSFKLNHSVHFHCIDKYFDSVRNLIQLEADSGLQFGNRVHAAMVIVEARFELVKEFVPLSQSLQDRLPVCSVQVALHPSNRFVDCFARHLCLLMDDLVPQLNEKSRETLLLSDIFHSKFCATFLFLVGDSGGS